VRNVKIFIYTLLIISILLFNLSIVKTYFGKKQQPSQEK